MSDDRSGSDPGEKSWINKFAELFTSEPRNRGDMQDVLAVAVENEIIDSDARSIMEGAMEVSDMQALRGKSEEYLFGTNSPYKAVARAKLWSALQKDEL